MRFFALVFGVFLLFRTTAFAMYHIPSESMLPTLAVGDRITVNKFAYGYSRHSVPFSLAPRIGGDDGRLFGRLPDRGDIVVFKHPKTGEAYIKRVVGLPGDAVALRNGRLFINGVVAPRAPEASIAYREHRGSVIRVTPYEEQLPAGRAHLIYERSDRAYADQFSEITIPEDHLFVLGDNRDNSIDSRFLESGVGLMPVENLVGRADHLAFSTHRCRREDGLSCLGRRWFTSLYDFSR
ncbi:MAG: signal peptidase I [Planctomycetota bacterium]